MSTAEERPSILPSSVIEEPPPSPGRQPLSDDQRKAIAAALDDLAVRSAVALRAMRQTDDPEWNLQTLNATIRNDQGLAARFLRLANSAFFGVRCTITTLDRAINLVGIKRVRSVLLTAALEGLHDTKTSNFTGTVLWDHALATGCVSQFLAEGQRRCDPDEAFIAGLLHDIGRPVMDQLFSARYAEVVELANGDDAASWLAAEHRVFRFDHTDVGFVVATEWGFPPALAEVARCHHDPTVADTDPTLCATVSLANSMCAKAALGPDQQPTLDLTALPSAEMLDLDARVEAVMEQVPNVVEQARMDARVEDQGLQQREIIRKKSLFRAFFS